jgi:hypothetical protein
VSWFTSLCLTHSCSLEAQSFRMGLLQNSSGNFFSRICGGRQLADASPADHRLGFTHLHAAVFYEYIFGVGLAFYGYSFRSGVRALWVSPNVFDWCGSSAWGYVAALEIFRYLRLVRRF